MILAAFGAVHGNLNALTRVLEAIEHEGIQTLACTGDYALGPQPNEVIALLKSRQVHVVQGDTDRLLARLVRKRKRLEREIDPAALAELEQAHQRCSSANLEWLAALPHKRTLKVDGESVALFNGTLSSVTIQIHPDDPDEIFRRQREVVPAAAFVCGGGPVGFSRIVDDAVFANPGPLVQVDNHTAAYVVVSTESASPSAEFRTVALASTI